MIQNTANEVLGWNKISGVNTFKKRLDDRRWRTNSYFGSLDSLEHMRSQLSRDGIVMSNDIEPIINQIEYILDTFEQMDNQYLDDNMIMTVGYEMPRGNRYLGGLTLNVIKFPEPMKIWAGKHDPQLKGEVPSYTLRISFNINLAHHVNMGFAKKFSSENKGKWKLPNVSGYTRNDTDPIWWGGSNDAPKGLYFPYMSPRWGNNDEDLQMCFGDLTSQIVGALWNLDGLALSIYLQQWATNYNVNSTNPLRNIAQMHAGRPSFLVDEYGKANDLGSVVGMQQNRDSYGSDCTIAPNYNLDYDSEIDIHYFREGLEDPEADMLYSQSELEYNIDFMNKDSYCAKYCTIKDQCNTFNALNIDSIFIKEALVGEIITLQRILKDAGYSPDTMDPDNMSYIKNSLKTNTSIYVLRERLSHLEVSVSEYNKRDEERTPEDKQKAIEEATLAWVARSGGTLQQRRR